MVDTRNDSCIVKVSLWHIMLFYVCACVAFTSSESEREGAFIFILLWIVVCLCFGMLSTRVCKASPHHPAFSPPDPGKLPCSCSPITWNQWIGRAGGARAAPARSRSPQRQLYHRSASGPFSALAYSTPATLLPSPPVSRRYARPAAGPPTTRRPDPPPRDLDLRFFCSSLARPGSSYSASPPPSHVDTLIAAESPTARRPDPPPRDSDLRFFCSSLARPGSSYAASPPPSHVDVDTLVAAESPTERRPDPPLRDLDLRDREAAFAAPVPAWRREQRAWRKVQGASLVRLGRKRRAGVISG